MNSSTEFNINIIIHIVILFTFLTVFYFLFASNLAREHFNDEIEKLIKSNINNFTDKLTLEQRNILKIVLNYDYKLKNRYSMPDAYVEEHNRWIKNSAIELIVYSIILLVVVLSIIYYKTPGVIINMLVENIIIFIFIGIVEYFFFMNVALKYVPASPSLLVRTLLTKFKESILKYS